MVSFVSPVLFFFFFFPLPFIFLTKVESSSHPSSLFLHYVLFWDCATGLAINGCVTHSVPCVSTSGGHFGVRSSSCLFLFYCTNMFDVPHTYVQVYAAAEDHCLALSLGVLAVWLSSLLALSLQCLGLLTVAI